MPTGHNNPPEVTINLSRELAEFLVKNCESNMEMGLLTMQTITSRDLLERIVDLTEKFKALRVATKEGLDRG